MSVRSFNSVSYSQGASTRYARRVMLNRAACAARSAQTDSEFSDSMTRGLDAVSHFVNRFKFELSAGVIFGMVATLAHTF